MFSNWLKRFNFKKPDRFYAFTMWITAPGRGKIKLGIPVGMTVGELEDHLHENYPGFSINREEQS